jgi:hypothetical protein
MTFDQYVREAKDANRFQIKMAHIPGISPTVGPEAEWLTPQEIKQEQESARSRIIYRIVDTKTDQEYRIEKGAASGMEAVKQEASNFMLGILRDEYSRIYKFENQSKYSWMGVLAMITPEQETVAKQLVDQAASDMIDQLNVQHQGVTKMDVQANVPPKPTDNPGDGFEYVLVNDPPPAHWEKMAKKLGSVDFVGPFVNTIYPNRPSDIEIGSSVYVKSAKSMGKVLRIRGNTYQVELGQSIAPFWRIELVPIPNAA